MEQLTIAVTLKRGTCRWCGCTYHDPCAGGCGWADRKQTLCTACVDFDRDIKSARGRQRVVEAYQIGVEAAES